MDQQPPRDHQRAKRRRQSRGISQQDAEEVPTACQVMALQAVFRGDFACEAGMSPVDVEGHDLHE